jgi:hypothetical protein
MNEPFAVAFLVISLVFLILGVVFFIVAEIVDRALR